MEENMLALFPCTLKNLSLDGCSFQFLARRHRPHPGEVRRVALDFYTRQEVAECYILSKCKQLERLSIKGSTWFATYSIYDPPSVPETIPQAMLIKMVRCLEGLRWLRSDLTDENIAMLKAERPEITFVSE